MQAADAQFVDSAFKEVLKRGNAIDLLLGWCEGVGSRFLWSSAFSLLFAPLSLEETGAVGTQVGEGECLPSWKVMFVKGGRRAIEAAGHDTGLSGLNQRHFHLYSYMCTRCTTIRHEDQCNPHCLERGDPLRQRGCRGTCVRLRGPRRTLAKPPMVAPAPHMTPAYPA